MRIPLLSEERDSDGEEMPLRADRAHRIVTENGMSGRENAGVWEGRIFYLESVFLWLRATRRESEECPVRSLRGIEAR